MNKDLIKTLNMYKDFTKLGFETRVENLDMIKVHSCKCMLELTKFQKRSSGETVFAVCLTAPHNGFDGENLLVLNVSPNIKNALVAYQTIYTLLMSKRAKQLTDVLSGVTYGIGNHFYV